MSGFVEKVQRTLYHWLTDWRKNNLIFGWIFINVIKSARIEDCIFHLNPKLFPLGYFSRFFFKVYEAEEVQFVNRYLNKDAKVLELGACLGVVSCVTNKKLSNPKNHIVVEANPNLITEIEKHRADNSCLFEIENKMVSDQVKNEFFIYNIPVSGSQDKKTHNSKILDSCERIEVPGVTFEALEEKHNINFDTLIMDIEGGEFYLIDQNESFFKKMKLMIIEFHPNMLNGKTMDHYLNKFSNMGFKNVAENNSSYVFEK